MFFTLKTNGQADEPYSFETTAPPFSKKREGKLAKVACIHCRMSKLKCSGEPQSCQRCRSKQLECRYPSAPRTQRRQPSPPDTPQEGPQEGVMESVMEGTGTDDDMITVSSSTRESTNSGSLNGSSLGFEVPEFSTPLNINMMLSDSEYIAPMDTVRPWEQQPFDFTASNSKTPWNDSLDLDDFDLGAGDPACPVEASALPKMGGGCSCLSRVVGTHEALEVALWSQRKLFSDADNMLQHQKKLLLECEELLECKECSALPAYIMLIISMCSRLLETLDDMCRDVTGGDFMEAARATNKAGLSTEENKKRKNGSDSGDSDESRRRYGLTTRSRRLDDDDERLVLQSLVTARVTRLDGLLGTLDKVVSRYSWPAHKGLLRELQDRLAGGAFNIE